MTILGQKTDFPEILIYMWLILIGGSKIHFVELQWIPLGTEMVTEFLVPEPFFFLLNINITSDHFPECYMPNVFPPDVALGICLVIARILLKLP